MEQQNNQGDPTTVTTTIAPPVNASGPVSETTEETPLGESGSDQGERTIDATSILNGKKINPRTGTQTSDDDPEGVYAANVYNAIQIEHAGHTLTQTTPGGAEKHAEVLSSLSTDGTKTATEPKPTTEAGVQNDAQDAKPSRQEELTGDHQIQQGETGAEDRRDLEDLHGGGSGSNAGAVV